MITIQAKAGDNLNEIFNTQGNDTLCVFLPKDTIFNQKVTIQRDNLVINGNNSTIVWNDHNGMREGFGTADSATVTVCSNNVKFINVVFENSFDYPGQKALRDESISKGMGLQAVAVYTDKEANDIAFDDCTFKSYQDTLFTDGLNNFFFNCTIQGNVDYIFGKAHAVFKDCKIISIGEGIVTAPSTKADSKVGLEFINCSFIHTENVPSLSVYLARPWHPGGKLGVCSYASFNNCFFSNHINKELWTTMKDSKGVIHTPEESRFSIN